MINLVAVFICLFSLLGISGCVGQGAYEKKVEEVSGLSRDLAEMQRRNVDLVKKNEKLQADATGLRAKIDELDETRKSLEQTIAGGGESPYQRIAELEREKGRLREDIAKILRSQDEQVRAVSRIFESVLERMKDEIALGQVRISEFRGTVTVTFLNKYLFEGNDTALSSRGTARLKKITDLLKDVKKAEITVGAFYDMPAKPSVRSARQEELWQVPLQRAMAVTRQFRMGGIDHAMLAAVTRGEFGLAGDSTIRDGRDKARRIDISITVEE